MLKYLNYLCSKLYIPALSGKNVKLLTKRFNQIPSYISDFRLTGFALDFISYCKENIIDMSFLTLYTVRQPSLPNHFQYLHF